MAPTAERSGPLSPRSVVFRAEIGSVPHRDRSPRSSPSHSSAAVVDGDSAVATSAFLRTIWIAWTISVGARTGAAQKHDGTARLRDAASPALRLVASNHGNTPPAGAVRRPRTRQNTPPEQPRATPHCHSCTATRTTSTRPGDSARARIRCSIPRTVVPLFSPRCRTLGPTQNTTMRTHVRPREEEYDHVGLRWFGVLPGTGPGLPACSSRRAFLCELGGVRLNPRSRFRVDMPDSWF